MADVEKSVADGRETDDKDSSITQKDDEDEAGDEGKDCDMKVDNIDGKVVKQ